MRLIGIDPGITGGISFFNNFTLVGVICMPTYQYTIGSGKKLKKKNMVDGTELGRLFKGFNPEVIYMEKVNAMPNQGTVSMFNFGKTVGIVEGVCGALQLRLETTRPQEWKSVILKDTDKDKQAAIDFCYTNFPDIDLKKSSRSKKDHDGKADAVCIGSYGLINEKLINSNRNKD